MATEMPIPQDYGRFIASAEEDAEREEFADIPEIKLFDQDVEEQEDGSAIVKLDNLKTPDESPDF